MKLLLGMMALITIMVSAAPSDYVKLLSHTPDCGDFRQPVCTTEYLITNPTLSDIAANQDAFYLGYQNSKTMNLGKQSDSITKQIIEFDDGKGYREIDPNKFDFNFEALKSYKLKVSAKKIWKQSQDNPKEWYVDNVDNVLTAFGHTYTEYAWWNTTFVYKQLINITTTASSSNTVWILNKNVSELITSGKLDQNGHCLKVVDPTETYEKFAENKGANLSIANLSLLVLNTTFASGNNGFYIYYANTVDCVTSRAKMLEEYGASGLIKAVWWTNNTLVNATSQPDFPTYKNNYTLSNFPTESRSLAPVGFANGNALARGGTGDFNNLASGTVVTFFKNTVGTSVGIVIKGVVGATDLNIQVNPGGKFQGTLDGTSGTNYIASTSNVGTTNYFLGALDWNGTSWNIWAGGALNNSLANVTGLPNYPAKAIGIGGLDGLGTANMTGDIVFILFFNKTLSSTQHQLLADYSKTIYQAEVAYSTIAPANFSFVPPTTTWFAYQNWYQVNVTFDDPSPSSCTLMVNNSANFTMALTANWCYYNVSNVGYGVHNYSVSVLNAGGFSNSSSVQFIQLLNASMTTLTTYDLVSGDKIYFNATFTNGTSSVTSPNTNSYYVSSISLPQGSNTLTVTNASYYDSISYLFISNETNTLVTILNPKSNPNLIFVRFHIASSGYTPIQNANVLIRYTLGATTYNVTSCISDSSGTCGIYLDSTKTFLVLVSATGYVSAISTITPVGPDYTISLTAIGVTINYPASYYGVTYQLSPAILDAIRNWTIINYTVKDSTNQLIAYGLNLTYNGVLIFNQTNSTPASGGTILVNFSSVGRVGNLTAIFHFQKSGYSVVVQTQSYTIYQNFTIMNWSLSSAMDRIRDEGKSPFMVMIVVLMVIAMAVGWVNRGMAIGAGTGILAVLLLAFTFPLAKQSFNASEILLLVVLGILAIALFRLRSGQ